MSVRGDLRVADKALTGSLLVDIATQRDMRPFTVKLSGTPIAPVFSGIRFHVEHGRISRPHLFHVKQFTNPAGPRCGFL